MSSGKVILGLVAGVAAGAALGIIFAPEKGCTTREQISQKGEDLVGNLKTRFEEFLFSIITKMEDAKSVSKGIVDKAEDKAQDVISDIKNTANSY